MPPEHTSKRPSARTHSHACTRPLAHTPCPLLLCTPQAAKLLADMKAERAQVERQKQVGQTRERALGAHFMPTTVASLTTQRMSTPALWCTAGHGAQHTKKCPAVCWVAPIWRPSASFWWGAQAWTQQPRHSLPYAAWHTHMRTHTWQWPTCCYCRTTLSPKSTQPCCAAAVRDSHACARRSAPPFSPFCPQAVTFLPCADVTHHMHLLSVHLCYSYFS